MIPTDSRLVTAMQESHRSVVACDYSVDGGPWTPLTEWNRYEVALIDGSVTSQRLSLQRREGTATFAGRTAYPDQPDHPLGPRSLLRLYRGAIIGTEALMVPLGQFRVTESTVDWNDLTVSVRLDDEMSWALEDRFVSPVSPNPSASRYEVLARLLTLTDTDAPDVLPGTIGPSLPGRTWTIDTDRPDTINDPVGETVFDIERQEALEDVAIAAGVTVFLDYDGQVRVSKRTVRGTGQPVQSYRSGPGGTYTELRSSWSMDGFANAAAVRWEGGVETATADEGPLTELLLGHTQRRVWDITDSGGSQAQAQQYARDIIGSYYGLQRKVEASVLVTPWVEPSDVIEVVMPGDADSPPEALTLVVDETTVPLAPGGTMKLGLREWRSA